MSTPKASMTELDGSLGILPTSAGKLQAILGCASSGTAATPAAYASASAVRAAFGNYGPLVEEACYALEHYGKPVVCCRTATTTVGGTSNLVTTGKTGTSVVTVDAAVEPYDSGEVVLYVILGGTIGTGPITLKWSVDGGRNISAAVSLGTAVTYTVPKINVKFNFAAGTLVTGDVVTVVATAPLWASGDLATAIDALGASKLPWEYATIIGNATGANLDTVEGKRTGLAAKGKHRWFQMHFRVPNVGESDAAYQTAFDASFGSHTSTGIEVYAGAAKVLSSNTTFEVRRSPIFAVAPIYANISEETDLAQILLGPLPGVQIRDDNGNLDEHDELEQPGLDDMKATVLRTWDGRDGVFVNNPRIHSPVGSDFVFVQYRRVMNIARTALQAYLETRLSADVVVDAATGFLLKSEADDIDSGANAALGAALDAKPKASPATKALPRFAVSRTDPLLSTALVHYQCRIVPLGYIKQLDGDIGFNNPALRVVTG